MTRAAQNSRAWGPVFASPDLLFQCTHALEKLRQSPERNDRTPPHAELDGGVATDDGPGCDVAYNAALGRHLDPVAYRDVPGDTDLPAK